MNIGQAIKILRQKNGMTQPQLAAKCGISTNALCSLETGKSYPAKATIEKLCQALCIPQAYLLVSSIQEDDFPEEKRVLYRAMLEPLRNELLTKTYDGRQQRDKV
jgi:transcriptional regulator with XRE-family HTH domain